MGKRNGKPTGRPISTGGLFDKMGGVYAYNHMKRVQKIAARVGGRDGELLLIAAECIRALAKKNKSMAQESSAYRRLKGQAPLSVSVHLKDAPEVVCDYAAEAPVIVFVIPSRLDRVRLTRGSSLPRGARWVGRFDVSADYREVKARIEAKIRQIADDQSSISSGNVKGSLPNVDEPAPIVQDAGASPGKAHTRTCEA